MIEKKDGIFRKTHIDGSITEYTADGGRRTYWSERRCKEFTRRCAPGAQHKQEYIKKLYAEYGKFIPYRPHSGPYCGVEYWIENEDGKRLIIKTPYYGLKLVPMFPKYEDAERTAQALGGIVKGSSYLTSPLPIDGTNIPPEKLEFER